MKKHFLRGRKKFVWQTFVIGLMAAFVIVSLTACADSNESAGATEDGDHLTVGIIQMMEHPALDLTRESFIAEMRSMGHDNIIFDHRNGVGADMTTLTSIAQIFVGNNVDLIVSIATPSTQAAAATTSDIPIVFSAVTDPVGAGFVPSFEHPDRNITGVSDGICVESIFELVAELTPDARTFGFVYNLGESNSVSIINDTKALFDRLGFEYIEATVASTAEVQQAALSLVGRVDAIFTPTDNTVSAAMPILAQVALDASLPVFVGADSMVFDGGLATVGVDYSIVGQETARIASQILGGTPIYNIPAVRVPEFRTIINRATAESLGISLDHFGDYVEIYEGR